MKFFQTIRRPIAVLAVSWIAAVLVGCGNSPPPPVSPVVSADSEEGKKALAEDEAERKLRKEQEARALSRKKNLAIPEEG